MSTSNDGSESVDQFLARIASLREGKDEASEERTRRLEEDFQKSRKERQARRLERARSLSPSKTGPARTTVLSSPAPMREIALNPPVDFSPQTSTLSRSNAVRTSPILEPKQRNGEVASSTPPALDLPTISSSTLSRSGTLSWQQRPSPRERNLSRPRPLSTIATIRPVSRDGDQSTSDQTEPTRQEIAASLASRDPTWFQQTQDRGITSAAFRKNQVEDTPIIETGIRSMRLPGLASESPSTTRPIQDRSIETSTQERPLPAKPVISSTLNLPAIDAASPKNQPLTKSVSPTLATDIQNDTSTERPDSESTFPAAMRSPSPTKGLGGFVQSAMMKRSDSVNKRWSVQATGGLKRGDSVAGVRPLSGLGSAHTSVRSREAQINKRDMSASPVTSRPGSSQGIAHMSTVPVSPESRALPRGPALEPASSADAKPADTIERPKTPPIDHHLSRSQSKTLDTRRWSPTKSSWLESTLLSQSEPPKLSPKKEDQPRWKVDLQRSRSKRDTSPTKPAKSEEQDGTPISEASADSTRSSNPPTIELSTDLQGSRQPVKPMDTGATQTTNELSTAQVDTVSKTLEVVADSAAHTHSDIIQNTTREPFSRSSVLMSPDNKSDKKPPIVKPKPRTPPKTDFRASLKPRAAPATDGDEAEPEFKAIFGKLKSAQTKNYVAPDVLKGNILSGKAALSLTGGPQKTKRVDEFKESILQKKEAMKTSADSKKQEAVGTIETQRPEAPLPEALARRRTLHKATPSITKMQESVRSGDFRPELKSKPFVPQSDKAMVAKQAMLGTAATSISSPFGNLRSLSPPKGLEVNEAKESVASRDLSKPLVPPKSLHAKTSADRLKEISPKQISPNVSSKEASTHSTIKTETLYSTIRVDKTVPVSTQAAAQSAKQTTTSAALPGGKLVSRLNPNLAALLSKGSSPRSPPVSSLSTDDIPQSPGSKAATLPAPEDRSSGELTHATKARAKGPKRRAPKSQSTLSESLPSSSPAKQPASTEEKPQEPTDTKSLLSSRTSILTKPLLTSSVTETETPINADTNKSVGRSVETPQEISSMLTSNTPAKTKPSIAAKSPELRRVSSTQNQQTIEQPSPKVGAPKTFEIATDKAAATSSPQTTTLHRFPSPKPLVTTKPLTPSKSRINTKNQPQVDTSPSKTTSTTFLTSGSEMKPATSRPVPPTVTRQPTPQKADVKSRGPTLAPTTSDAAIVSEILDKYFSVRPRAADRAEFDAPALLLATKEQAVKLKTVSKSIWEVASGGKKVTMPAQQEHILYEDCMYLVVHVCESSVGGKASEVYLWCGDQVSEGAIEDIQLFCRRDAREHNAKLEIIKQGKEPARFFQALGDIVIVRRGKSSALYMLCGRRHMGCMAFDEVDFAVENLCSGFPYLISAKFGKLYLWKGKGSAADEVGCARLIGMDIGLTGEIEEVDEGAETDLFWEAFSEPTTKKVWAREWQQRAEHNAYPPTLYRIEHDRPKSAGGFWGLRSASPPKSTSKASIELLEPLCHRDLNLDHVYILDTYRSVYVLIDSKASSKKAEFTTALHIAQEISMLSPSIQGRTLIPTCYVSFGELPADVKACFRKWPAGKRQNMDNKPSACVRLEDVMQALGI